MFEFKLALKYLKKNKKESILIIACIAVALTLILGVDIGANSIQLNQIENAKKIVGNYDGELRTNNTDDIGRLKQINGISNVKTVQDLGEFIPQDGLKTKLYTFNEGYLKSLNYELIKGRLPKDENEIVIDKSAFDESFQDKILNKNISSLNEIEYNSNGINKIYSEKKQYKVVGFIGRPDEYYKFGKSDAIERLDIISFVNSSKNPLPKDLIKYETVYDIENLNEKNLDEKFSYIREKYNPKLDNTIDIRQDSKSGISSNPYLDTTLRYYTDQQNNNEIQSKLFLIIIASFTIINFFNIMRTKNISQIAQLRVVGMSNKKVIKFYLIQTFLLFIIGSIIGFILSVLFARYAMSTLFTLNVFDISDFSKVKLNIPYKIVIEDLIIILTILLITILIPTLKALKKYPIDLLNKTEKIKHKVSSNKNIIISLLKNNLFRKKSKTIMSIILISFSGIMIIKTFASNLDYLDEQIRKNEVDSRHKYNYIVRPDFNADDNIKKVSHKDLMDIKSTDGVKDFRVDSYSFGNLFLEKNKLNKLYIKSDGYKGDSSNIKEVRASFSGIDNFKNIDEFVKAGDINKLNESSEEYINVAVCNDFYNLEDAEYKEGIKNLKIGDMIDFKVKSKNFDGKYCYKSIKGKVVATLDNSYRLQNENLEESGIRICMNLKDLENITEKSYTQKILFNVDGKCYSKVNEKLENIKNNNRFLQIYRAQDYKYNFKICFPMIVMLLVLVSALFNIYIITSLNINNNIKEFSILRAIGLNKKSLKKIVIYESTTYALLGSLLSVIIIAIKDIKYIKYLKEVYTPGLGIDLKVKSIYMPPKESIIYMVIIVSFALVVGYFKSKSIDKINIIEGINEN
ncbi:ABC transporter permease [Paraclostridium bifermentans]|uniref:ABC transporter permease n=1 Tax=Paraclostridium bifermentans TaxID=1490 RepID=UPI003D26A363